MRGCKSNTCRGGWGHRAAAIAPILVWFSLSTVSGASINRSFINNTGQVVNDLHLFERNGMNTILSFKSGSGPGLSNLPNTTAPGGGAAQNTATLSGANVPIGGQVNVHITIPAGGLLGNSGFLDWQWTSNNNPVGPVHLNAQAIFASLDGATGPNRANVIVAVTNGSSSTADYTNFELGTLAADVDITTIDEDPGGLPPGSTVLLGPTSFVLAGGASTSFTVPNVDLTQQFGSYADVSVGGDSFFQLQAGQIPEPGPLALLAFGCVVLIGALRAKKKDRSQRR